MKNLAIIPARGGSKRIPKKNIKDFFGKPVIAYSIENAKKSGLFEKIIVSTNSEEIAGISKQFGAEVPFFRSDRNSDDHATLADVIEEIIATYNKEKYIFEYGCCILPTAPLISLKNLQKGYELIKSGTFDSIRPVVQFHYPVQRAFRFDYNTNKVSFLYPEFMKTRSQDLEQAFHDSGQFYWFKPDAGLKGENKGAFIISEMEAHDIDNEHDWEIAEIKYKLLYQD